MKASIFDALVRSWSSTLTWSKGDLAKASRTLMAISRANGGELAPDVHVSDQVSDDHAIRRAADAIMRNPIDSSSVASVLASLKAAQADVVANPFGVARSLHSMRASAVLIENLRREKMKTLNDGGVTDAAGGALILDGEYLPYVNALLSKAKLSVYVMMFFIKYEEGKRYPVNALVDNLVAAQRRGVDVKVILDRDPDAGVVGSRLVNEPAFRYLKEKGVSVVYDDASRMTHSKLILVDAKTVVLGSHNWTAGSLMAYDDTSVRIESVDLARRFKLSFDGYWTKYNISSP
jgi:phosphatidylserine/phosphatidylglycerophosphate/cardiolipin synthase-like enzyme